MLKSLFRLVERIPLVHGAMRRVLPKVVATINGIKFELHPSDNYTDRRIWLDASMPEERSLRALEVLMHGKKALFVDIGANSGVYTIRLGRVVLQESTLVAVEPNPVMVTRLRRNLELNGLARRVAVVECALAAEAGEATMLLADGNYGQASLRAVQKQCGELSVRTRTLDDVVPSTTDHTVFSLKIDVEGFEDEVLCRYLETTHEGRLPDAMLIETTHSAEWSKDLPGLLVARGYRATFEGEGNTLFVREG